MLFLKRIKSIFSRLQLSWIENFISYKRGHSRKGRVNRKKYSDLDSMIESHFAMHSAKTHPCRSTISLALNMLNNEPATILETGSSAWGINSSLLFDDYVNSFGGSFHSVDIRSEPMRRLVKQTTGRSCFARDDSVNFLRNFIQEVHNIDLVYLDSWDVDWHAPLASAVHGFTEFLIVLPVLKKNAGLLLIDDTPRDSSILHQVGNSPGPLFEKFYQTYNFYPGKGGLVKYYLETNRVGKKIEHEYQLLWQF